MIILTILGVAEILCNFRLVLEGKPDKDTLVFKIRVLRKVFGKQFCIIRCRRQHLSLNRAGIADLPLLRTLLTIRLKFQEPSFWEVMDALVLLANANLTASRTLLLACLNFTLNSQIYSVGTCKKWTMMKYNHGSGTSSWLDLVLDLP